MSVSVHGTNGITFNDGSTQTTRPAVGFRNRIINGDMRIWQRGTTISNPNSSNFYTADRWGCNRASDVSGAVISRISAELTGFQYALASQRVAGNTGVPGVTLWYSFESSDVYDLAGSSVTLSYWAKTGTTFSGGSGMSVAIYSGTGIDQRIYSMTGLAVANNTSQALTSTWSRYTLTATVPANATQIGLQFTWSPTGTAGADDSIKITGVQLEAGSTASDFERRPIGTELALCQRYYDKSYSMNVAPGTVTNNGMVSAVQEAYAGAWFPGGGSIKFATEMRIAPNFNYRDNQGTLNRFSTYWNGSIGNNVNLGIALYAGTKGVALHQTSAAASGTPLLCHYTADAEL